MKKQLLVATGLVVLAAPAFASKARLQALGEDIYGSFYINDNRNIFYNAAQVNNHKDLVTMEWGATTATRDDVATPRAEGGFFKSHGNLVYGVQLGSESNSSNGFRSASGVAALEQNNIDLFVGGDAGVKWGANVTYSKNDKDENTRTLAAGTATDNKQEAIRTRFGVIAGDLEGYANINIANKASSTIAGVGAGINGDNEFKGNTGYQFGAIYNMNDYRLFADYRALSGKANGAAAVDGKIESSQLQVGAGRSTRLNDKATLFTKVQYQKNDAKNNTTAASVGAFAASAPCELNNSIFCSKYSGSFVPVVVGLEYDAASWLVLRGSVAQTIWGNEKANGNKSPYNDSTVVNAGATLKFGELSVDGVVGNSAGGANASGNSTSAGNGNLRTDNLMSRVSMTYRF